jgi:RHO1 GDP-GTP exchange protein 1/2
LESEESIIKFQEGELFKKDEEWYRLVPDEAREALGKQEPLRF